MYTNKFGQTHINEAMKVVSLNTRVTEAFSQEGVIPNPNLRKEAIRMVEFLPNLTAHKAVLLVLDGARAPRKGVV